MATTKNQVHRSISLPSRPHPTTIKLHQQLHKLKTWESTSSSSSSSHSICTSLSMLDDLYTSLDDLLHMSSTQQAISHHQNEPCVEELLEASLRVLDICGITKDTLLLQIKENVRSLHSALRRRKQDSCVERSVGEYKLFTKKTNKNVIKKLVTTLKQMEIKFGATPILNDDDVMGGVIRVIREVIMMNISIFQSLLAFLVMKPKGVRRKWFLVAKWMHKGLVACEEEEEDDDDSEMVNEVKNVESALKRIELEGSSVEKMKIVHGRLEDLEMAIESIENGLESVFRRLIKTRASLLNIISL